MSSDLNVIITFPYSSMAKVDSSGYSCDSLALAYNNAGVNDIIYARAVTFTENLTMNNPKTISVLGGCDAWYLPQNDWTVLHGVLTLGGGSLTADRLVVK